LGYIGEKWRDKIDQGDLALYGMYGIIYAYGAMSRLEIYAQAQA
jgi:hypothetical protein